MLAAILLERHEISVHASASMSILRYMNNGPHNLLFTIYGSMRQNKGLVLTVFMLLCTTTLLQFTSTLLATDLGYGDLITLRQSSLRASGISLDNYFRVMRDSYVDFWAAQPPDFPTFAELIESAPDEKVIDGVRDTGTTIRAFLPIINSTMRTSIEHFDGVATILDSRVVCVRPTVHPSLSIGYSQDLGYILNGTLRPVAIPSGVINYSPDKEWVGRADPGISDANNSVTLQITDEISGSISNVTLNRPQRFPFSVDKLRWPIIQRVLSTEAPALVSSLDPRYPTVVSSNSSQYYANNTGLSYFANNYVLSPDNLTYGIVNDTVPLMTGRSYLLLHTSAYGDISMLQTGAAKNFTQFFFGQQQDLNGIAITTSNEWLNIKIPRIPDWRLSATLCFDSIVSINANVTVKSDGIVKEPSMGIENATTQSFLTNDLRRQLGTHSGFSMDSPQRGVMHLLNSTEQLRKQV